MGTGTFQKYIYSKLSVRFINFYLIEFSRIHVNIVVVFYSQQWHIRCVFFYADTSEIVYTVRCVIGKSQQLQLNNVKATTNAYQIRHYLKNFKKKKKKRTIAIWRWLLVYSWGIVVRKRRNFSGVSQGDYLCIWKGDDVLAYWVTWGRSCRLTNTFSL